MCVNKNLKKRKREREKAKKIEAAKKTAIRVGIGTALGAGLGLLLAPKAGKETRDTISNGANKAVNNLRRSSTEARSKINQILRKVKRNTGSKDLEAEILESQED